MACSKVGSRMLEAVWNCASLSQRQSIAQELGNIDSFYPHEFLFGAYFFLNINFFFPSLLFQSPVKVNCGRISLLVIFGQSLPSPILHTGEPTGKKSRQESPRNGSFSVTFLNKNKITFRLVCLINKNIFGLIFCFYIF